MIRVGFGSWTQSLDFDHWSPFRCSDVAEKTSEAGAEDSSLRWGVVYIEWEMESTGECLLIVQNPMLSTEMRHRLIWAQDACCLLAPSVQVTRGSSQSCHLGGNHKHLCRVLLWLGFLDECQESTVLAMPWWLLATLWWLLITNLCLHLAHPVLGAYFSLPHFLIWLSKHNERCGAGLTGFASWLYHS